jgi:hypothetical protein
LHGITRDRGVSESLNCTLISAQEHPKGHDVVGVRFHLGQRAITSD